MPRYYFHIHDSEGPIFDDEGMDFADDVAAKQEGKASAAEILGNDLRFGIEITDRRIEVLNDEGVLIAIYRLPDSLH